MNSPPNNEWEQALDIDDSDLRLTPSVRPNNNPHIVPEITTTTQTLFLSQNNQVDTHEAKLRKIADTWEGWEESLMSIQKYIRKFIEDVGEDDDFTLASWLSVLNYVNEDGGILTGCFRDVKKFLKNGKLEKVVVVINSCTLNMLDDLTVTLKDLSGTIFDTIHYKVLTYERFSKAITVEAALILHNDFVFFSKQSNHHYLNITKKNIAGSQFFNSSIK
uniref:Homologous recombination OB-fold protein OB-fold domain-containing protein n=1 Tax=Tanacetum cinerariifolium TaxID=118510 RepID=A0A6L2N094_TANCI|nr:hypothetical protein [Tanacetum cinerariifolium]